MGNSAGKSSKKSSTSDAVAAFFAVQTKKPLAWLETYMDNLTREQVWSAQELAEIRRAIVKWMED